MENDNGRLNFKAGIDTTDLQQDANKAYELLGQLGLTAVEQGSIIDKALGSQGSARTFTVLEAAIRGVGTQIKYMDFNTAEEKIGSLSYIIQQQEISLANATATLDRYKEQAQEAFNAGDTGRLEALTKDIEDQSAKVQQMTKDAEDYRNALETVLETAGQSGGQTVSIPQLYKSDKDLQEVEKLKKKIQEVSTEIAKVGTEGGNTADLMTDLSDLKDDLANLEKKAADAAKALGEDLGGRASEAQQNLYALNQAVAEQQKKVDELSQVYQNAKANLEQVQSSENATTEEIEKAIAVYDTASQSLTNATNKLTQLQTQQDTAKGKWKEVTQEIKTHDSRLVKMLGGYQNYQVILKNLPAPLQMCIQGITGMTTAAKAFLKNPLGMALAAIALALQAVKTWFDSTAEGQQAFAKVSGYVSGVLGQLKEVVIAVGKSIYSLGKIAVTTFQLIKSAVTGNLSGVTENFKKLKQNFENFGTDITSIGDKVTNFFENFDDVGKKTSQIKLDELALNKEVSEWAKKKQELERQQNEAYGVMMNPSKSTAERKKAAAEYENLIGQISDKEKEFADRRVDLQKKRMELTSNTIQDEEKLNQLEAERAAIDTRQAQQLASLQRRNGMLDNKDLSAAQKLQTEQQQRSQALTAIGEQETALRLWNEQQELSVLQEGHTKKMAELEKERKEEEKELEKMRTQLIALNRKAGTETGEDGLTDNQRQQILNGRENIEKTYQKGVQDILNDELSDVLTYEQKRWKIQEEYEQKRLDLYEKDSKGNYVKDESGNMKLRAGVTEGNLDELKRQEDEALNAVDEQFAEREDTYQSWCNQITNVTIDKLDKMLAEAEDAMSEAEKSGESGQTLAVARAKVNTLKTTKKKKQADKDVKDELSPDKKTNQDWQDLYKTLNECNQAFEKIGDTVGGVVGDIISAAGQITSSALSMINGIKTLTQAAVEGTKDGAEGADTALSTVEKASVILTVIQAAMQIATAIVNLFNNDAKYQEEIDALQNRIDELQWELDNADIVRLQKNAGTAIEKVRVALRQTYIEWANNQTAVNAYAASFEKMTGKVVKNTDLLQKAADKLATAYGNVAYTADKALGEEKYSSSREQLENISQQMLLIQQQINDEEAKKKTDKDQIAEWEQQLEELGEQAVSVINDMVEEIIGGSSSEIAEQLGDAFIEAFQEGEDAAAAWGDKVNDIVADILKNLLISEYLEQPLGEIFDKYKSQWFQDGTFLGIQAVQDSMTSFADDLNAVGDTFETIWEALPDSVKDMMSATASSSREASEKGIATASQESVDELNGRATAIQGHTYTINENTKILVSSTNLILQSVLNIERYTETMNENLATVNVNVKTVRDTVNDIALKGVKLL